MTMLGRKWSGKEGLFALILHAKSAKSVPVLEGRQWVTYLIVLKKNLLAFLKDSDFQICRGLTCAGKRKLSCKPYLDGTDMPKSDPWWGQD